MADFIHNFIAWVETSKYVLLFLGAALEGPVVMITGGFLYRLGEVYFIPMYLSLLAGDLIADIGWYLVGYYGGGSLVNKYGKLVNITPEIIAKVEQRFRTYQNTILIVSKLTMGFGFSLATLITAGIMKVSLKKFMVINLLGGLIWTLFVVFVGYFFGNVYDLIPGSFKVTFILIILVLVLLALRAINRYLVSVKI